VQPLPGAGQPVTPASINPNDIQQRGLGDCHLQATLYSIASQPGGPDMLARNITLNPNGTYTVTLKFAEPNRTGPGRVFHVDIEGQRVLTSYDVWADVGALTAVDKTFVASVTGGQLDVVFTSVSDFAIVSAIQVVPGSSASPTPTSTSTGAPSATPTGTSAPTSTPTGTAAPTSTPTGTSAPTDTPTVISATSTPTSTPTPKRRLHFDERRRTCRMLISRSDAIGPTSPDGMVPRRRAGAR
jgi:hypothetical protein